MPEGYVDEPHIGGETCPFCWFVADNQGFKYSWYMHPKDPAAPPRQADKPPGRSNAYIHQVFKCNNGLSIAHMKVRKDREAGIDSSKLLSPRTFVMRQP